MLQDKENMKDCSNCINNTHWSQVRWLSRGRNPCDTCDYCDHGERFVPSNWEEEFSDEEIAEYEEGCRNRGLIIEKH